MPITYTADHKGQNNGVGAAITSNTLTVATGDLITVIAAYDDNVGSTAWTVSNTGTAITWTQVVDTNTANNCRLVLWSGIAGATPPTTVTVTSTAGSATTATKSLSTIVHKGFNTGNPLPSGNVFTGANLTDASRTINPTAPGSALWMVAADFLATNTFAAIANNTLVGTFNEAARMTSTLIRPTTQPRPDGAAFTLGETDTSGTIAYIAFEVLEGFIDTSQRIKKPKKAKKSSQTSDFTGFGLFSSVLSAAGLFDKDLITVVSSGGATSHDTSGALVGQGSTVAGTANHITVHATTGALVGQGSTIAGNAARTRAHNTTGAIVGQGSTIAGTAQHNVPHTTSGALVGQGSTISGSAARTRVHDTSGALIGQGSTINGSAARSSGAVTHDTTGALVGQGAVVTGTANRTRVHDTSGALVGQGSTINGTANRTRVHDTSGALVGQGSTISGSAARTRVHDTTGVLVGQGSTINGTAARSGAPVIHDTSGALVGQGSTLSGISSKTDNSQNSGGYLTTGNYYYKQRHAPLRAQKTKRQEVTENDNNLSYVQESEVNLRFAQQSENRQAKARAVKRAQKRLFDAEQAMLKAKDDLDEANMRLIAYLEQQEAEIEEENIIVRIMMELL